MIQRTSLLLIAFSFALGACVAGGGDGNGTQNTDTAPDAGTTADTGNPPENDAVEPAMGSLTGKVVDDSGTGLEGVLILGCDDDSCLTTKTGAGGTYNLAVPMGWRKMQVMGTALGKMNMLFFQDVTTTEPTAAPRDLVLVGFDEGFSALSKEAGGTAVLAGGALTITADPGVAKYPIGAVEEIYAAPVTSAQLASFDVEDPWTGNESGTLAFHINPLPVLTLEDGQTFGFSVTGGSGEYMAYYVNDHYGTLHEAGPCSADADGNVVGTVPVLTSLILVPVQ